MITSRISASLALAVALTAPLAARAEVSVAIDANANCFDTIAGSVVQSVVNFQLDPGNYIASLTNNNMSCSYNNQNRGCHINSVIIRGIDDVSPYSNTGWGQAISTPTVVSVSGTAAMSFTAFIMDNGCSDNTGKAILTFQKAN
jgi:hypothetical protein